MIEYRVVWQRAGLPKRSKIYQTRAGAENFVRTLRGEFKTGRPEEDYDSARDFYEAIPALTWGPHIEERDVGGWRLSVPVRRR